MVLAVAGGVLLGALQVAGLGLGLLRVAGLGLGLGLGLLGLGVCSNHVTLSTD